jgi:molecular chaperone DnaK
VILVGGTTYIPAVRELVQEVIGKPGRTDVPPDLAVAMGAAIHAASARGQLDPSKDLILADVCPMGLGIDVVSEVGGRMALVYSPLIGLNQKIPYRVEKQYSLLTPDQREVRFRLYQDRTGEAVFPEDAIPTGIEGLITDIPPALYGSPHPLVVEFSYDANGEVRIRAAIPGLNKDCNVIFSNSGLRMSKEEIDAAKARTSGGPNRQEEVWRAHARAEEFAPLIEKAEAYLARIPARERSPLVEVVSRLKDALATNSETRVEAAKRELIQALFELADD